MRYLFVKNTTEGAVAYPCDARELKLAVKGIDPAAFIVKWPAHGHGPEWNMGAEDRHRLYGVMVFDRDRSFEKPLTIEEIHAVVEGNEKPTEVDRLRVMALLSGHCPDCGEELDLLMDDPDLECCEGVVEALRAARERFA